MEIVVKMRDRAGDSQVLLDGKPMPNVSQVTVATVPGEDPDAPYTRAAVTLENVRVVDERSGAESGATP